MSLLAATKFTDLNPTTTSNSKNVLNKVFLVNRTNTTSFQAGTLPAGAYITCVWANNLGGVAANGVTSSTINVFAGLGATNICPIDVKTSIAPVAPYLRDLDTAATATGGDNVDQRINLQYVDVGGASTVGGPWMVVMEYVV